MLINYFPGSFFLLILRLSQPSLTGLEAGAELGQNEQPNPCLTVFFYTPLQTISKRCMTSPIWALTTNNQYHVYPRFFLTTSLINILPSSHSLTFHQQWQLFKTVNNCWQCQQLTCQCAKQGWVAGSVNIYEDNEAGPLQASEGISTTISGFPFHRIIYPQQFLVFSWDIYNNSSNYIN